MGPAVFVFCNSSPSMMVNFMYWHDWIGHRVPGYLFKHYSGVSVRVEGLNKTKILTFSWIRENSSSLLPHARTFFFLSLNLNWSISSFLILSLWPLDLNHTIGSPGSPACWPQWFRLVCPRNPAKERERECVCVCVCVCVCTHMPGDLNMQPTLRATYL